MGIPRWLVGTDVTRPSGVPDDAIVRVLRVPPEGAGVRLDVFLSGALRNTSRTRAKLIAEHSAFSPTGRRRKASDYAYHEKALRQAVEAMGCEVTSNMTSLVVLNLPGKLKGKEKELVQGARAQGFGIWPTLSEPVQVRIGILNQLSPQQIGEIVSRFADAMLAMGADFDKAKVMNGLKAYYAKAA